MQRFIIQIKCWLKQNYDLTRFERSAQRLVETNSVDAEFERRWHELVIWGVTISEFLEVFTPEEVERVSTILMSVYFGMVDLQAEIPEYLVNSLIHIQSRVLKLNERKTKIKLMSISRYTVYHTLQSH